MESQFSSTMRPMTKKLPSIAPKYPMHVVQSRSHLNQGKETGLTISEEEINSATANAEYEVLKAIISREQYLLRLTEAVRTVGKTFKPEVIDILDLVRAASLDVVEKVILWRENKGDANASFMWNGVNYLLKMPSDLDYLADYLAIQRWTGFPLQRNPFCVPFPMDPKVAGVTRVEGGMTIGRASTATPSTKGQAITNRTASAGTTGEMQSFIYHEDMKRIRIAESVIMKAEEQFGTFSRDPDGRLVPLTQALTRKTAVELKKDDRRPLTEASHTTFSYAPHALEGGIGLAEAGWAPPILSAQQQLDALNDRKISPFLQEVDDKAHPKKKGLALRGGELQASETRGSASRPHKPIRATISTKVDFKRYRQVQSLGERLTEIQRLKEALQTIEQAQNTLSTKSAGERDRDVFLGAINPQQSDQPLRPRELDVLRSSLSNRMGKGFTAPLPKSKVLSVDGSKSIPENYLQTVDSNQQPTTSRSAKSDGGVGRATSSGGLDAKKLDFSGLMEKSTKDVGKLYEASAAPVIQQGLKRPPSEGNLLGSKSGESSSEKTSPSSKTLRQSQSVSAIDITDPKQHIFVEESATQRRLQKLSAEEDIISSLKKHEVSQKAQQRSREIERKRRLLSEAESTAAAKKMVIEEKENVFDYYATRIQSAVRGWIVRRWVQWYLDVSEKAAVIVQALIRGGLDRRRVRQKRQIFQAATIIQKNFRGWLSRGTSATMAKKKNLTKNAVTIQRIWRGVLGKRRAASKRDLDKAAKKAFDAVDAQSLVSADVKELAKRIIYAIEEPSTTTFPPDEVLYLIQQTVLIIQSARGYLGLADYDFFHARHYLEVKGDEMDWKQAAKVVNRSETFIRLVRALAFGPGAKPPRLIQLPQAVNALYAAQANNPTWNIHTFQHMGKGSRICVQLFKWLTAMIEVSDRQQQFLSLIATSFPDWLPKLNEMQQSARQCEFEIELNKKAMEVVGLQREKREEDEDYCALLEKESKMLKRLMNDAKSRLKHLVIEMAKLKNDQSTREMVALTTIEERLTESRTELDALATALQETTARAEQGDRAAKEFVQELRLKLTNQKLKNSEMEGQKKLLEIQVESNKAKRRADSRLPSAVLSRVLLAGEAKAAYIIAQLNSQAMIHSAGVRHVSDLPAHLMEIYEPLHTEEDRCRHEARKYYVEAEKARKSHEEYLTRTLAENDIKEQKSKNKMLPSEQELEEERLENEKEALEERRKHMQYLPDHVLFDAPKRPRPIILALARDLPGLAKKAIHQEITTSMPGSFVYLNTDVNFGLDVQAIQAVITAEKNVIIHVDHGLTRATRDSFLHALELTLHALVPTPLVALAIGSSENVRGGGHGGVDQEDLPRLRDQRLKVVLENLYFLAMELQSAAMIKMGALRASEVEPSSSSLALVCEACYLFYSEEQQLFDLPHRRSQLIHTWPMARKLFSDVGLVARKLTSLRLGRGPNRLALINCLTEYFHRPQWPSAHDKERLNDPLLHGLASLLEYYVEGEILYMQGGGAPPQAFTKNSMKGIQTVVTVSDQVMSVSSLSSPSAAKTASGRRDGMSWKEASALLMKAALEDLRVSKSVTKVDGEVCMISVYRDRSAIFLEVYESSSSRTYLTAVSVYDVPSILVPNGTERRKKSDGGSNSVVVPDTPMKMYEQLIALLRFQRPRFHKPIKTIGAATSSASIVSSPKELVCRRQYSYLGQFVTHRNGHRLILKCYEGALGEVFFQGYLPSYCARFEALVGTEDRLKLIRDAERNSDLYDKNEFIIAQDETDCLPLLPYLIDRLRVTPSVAMHEARHPPSPSAHSGVISYFCEMSTRLDGFVKVADEQGFRLKPRLRGGAGKVHFRRVHSFLGVRYLLEGRLVSKTRLLVLRAYEPVHRRMLTVEISVFLREVLLYGSSGVGASSGVGVGADDDNLKRYHIPLLLKRLRIDWRGNHQLLFDRTIVRIVATISKQRFQLSALAVDDHSMEILLHDPLTSERCLGVIDDQQLQALCSLVPNTEMIGSGKRIGDGGKSEAIIHTMREVHDDRDESLLHRGSSSSAFDMLKVLKDVGLVATLLKRLSLYLVAVDSKTTRGGFITTRCPVTIELAYIPPPSTPTISPDSAEPIVSSPEPLETALRFRTRLIESNVENYQSRTQPPAVFLEKELDALALARSKEADAREAEILSTSQQLSQHLETLGEEAVTAISDATSSAAEWLLDSMQQKIVDRLSHRENPGKDQEDILVQRREEKKRLSLEAKSEKEAVAGEEKEIMEGIWRVVLEMGLKAQFREQKVKWHGHIAVKILETNSWIGSEGMGKCYKFIIYEPNVAQHFEGIIRSKKHLIEVLGLHGRDLLDEKKEKEMLIFICRNRLEVVVNKISELGEVNPSDAPPYRIEFLSDRLYSQDKVTPVNATTEEDDEVNSQKLLEIENARGRKIMRLVRRVSGILMQLTVFELPKAVAEAAIAGYIPSDPTLLGIDVNIPELAKAISRDHKAPSNNEGAIEEKTDNNAEGNGDNENENGDLDQPPAVTEEQDINLESGFAEVRTILHNLHRHLPPAFRVVGYDPRSKRKVVLAVPPQAILEVAGGVFSPYLDPERRKELAKIVCDALILFFPTNQPFELTIPWSGANKVALSTAEIGRDKKATANRSSADRVIHRPGRVFRSVMRISKYDLVVSIFATASNQTDATNSSSSSTKATNQMLVFNFYSPSVSEAAELAITEEEQIARLNGQTLLSYTEGTIRAAAIRRFCRFFRAEIIEDIVDPTHRVLHVVLLPPDKAYLTEYEMVRIPPPGEDIRPVGIPGIFFPLDTCGRPLHRRGMTLWNKDKTTTPPQKDFLVTVYTKSLVETPEKGLVIKFYDRSTSSTSILHLGPSELMRICTHADEPDLLRDMVTAKQMEDGSPSDDLTEGLKEFTVKGDLEKKTKDLVNHLVDVVLQDLGYYISPQDTIVPYVVSAPKGCLPV